MPFDPAIKRAGRRQCQLRAVADRAGREHCRRPVVHRLSAGTEVAKGRSLQQTRSATGEAGSFPQSGDFDGTGTPADAGCPAGGVIKRRDGYAAAGAVSSSTIAAIASAASVVSISTELSIAVCGEVAQRRAL